MSGSQLQLSKWGEGFIDYVLNEFDARCPPRQILHALHSSGYTHIQFPAIEECLQHYGRIPYQNRPTNAAIWQSAQSVAPAPSTQQIRATTFTPSPAVQANTFQTHDPNAQQTPRVTFTPPAVVQANTSQTHHSNNQQTPRVTFTPPAVVQANVSQVHHSYAQQTSRDTLTPPAVIQANISQTHHSNTQQTPRVTFTPPAVVQANVSQTHHSYAQETPRDTFTPPAVVQANISQMHLSNTKQTPRDKRGKMSSSRLSEFFVDYVLNEFDARCSPREILNALHSFGFTQIQFPAILGCLQHYGRIPYEYKPTNAAIWQSAQSIAPAPSTQQIRVTFTPPPAVQGNTSQTHHPIAQQTARVTFTPPAVVQANISQTHHSNAPQTPRVTFTPPPAIQANISQTHHLNAQKTTHHSNAQKTPRVTFTPPAVVQANVSQTHHSNAQQTPRNTFTPPAVVQGNISQMHHSNTQKTPRDTFSPPAVVQGNISQMHHSNTQETPGDTCAPLAAVQANTPQMHHPSTPQTRDNFTPPPADVQARNLHWDAQADKFSLAAYRAGRGLGQIKAQLCRQGYLVTSPEVAASLISQGVEQNLRSWVNNAPPFHWNFQTQTMSGTMALDAHSKVETVVSLSPLFFTQNRSTQTSDLQIYTVVKSTHQEGDVEIGPAEGGFP